MQSIIFVGWLLSFLVVVPPSHGCETIKDDLPGSDPLPPASATCVWHHHMHLARLSVCRLLSVRESNTFYLLYLNILFSCHVSCSRGSHNSVAARCIDCLGSLACRLLASVRVQTAHPYLSYTAIHVYFHANIFSLQPAHSS